MKPFKFITTLLLTLAAQSATAASSDFHVSQACMTDESWTVNSSEHKVRMEKWLGRFQAFTHRTASPLFSFSQAILLKRLSSLMQQSDFERGFSEYWVGRIFFELNMDALAHQAFHSIYENSEISEVKKAAFVCMAQIEKRSPDWKLPAENWSNLPFSPQDSNSDAEALFLALLGNHHSEALLKSLPGEYQAFLRGFEATHQRKYSDAIAEYTSFLSFLNLHPAHFLNRYVDDAHLFLGRSLYSVARFKEASEQFQKVRKTSNLQIEALNNLAWAYLLDQRYDDAIGISMQLRTGALKNTFSPEPLMVSAMALNELCLYPDSIRVMKTFVQDYASSFNWLENHQNADNWYAEALKRLKPQAPGAPKEAVTETAVPIKVLGEWVKTPSFLTRQLEINQLIEETHKIASLQHRGANEQDQLTKAFLDNAGTFVKDVKIAKLKLKTGEALSAEWSDKYVVLKKQLTGLTRFYQASKVWKNIAKNYEKKLPTYRQELVRKINVDLQKKNQHLLSELRKVRENTDLIEIEIYNGASQDLIWKNAHPDFASLSEKMKDDKKQAKPSEVWNWGRFLASDIENAEVWEDELGALKADISDQCNQKDRYMKIKMQLKLSGGKS